MEWVKLTSAADTYEAQLIVGRLEAAGISSQTMKGPNAPGAWLTGSQSALGPIEVHVPEDRAAEAQGLLSLEAAARDDESPALRAATKRIIAVLILLPMAVAVLSVLKDVVG